MEIKYLMQHAEVNAEGNYTYRKIGGAEFIELAKVIPEENLVLLRMPECIVFEELTGRQCAIGYRRAHLKPEEASLVFEIDVEMVPSLKHLKDIGNRLKTEGQFGLLVRSDKA